uniref:TPM_phosphatase domain-containing protein n=1 Tax=Syphacia muris TaxID=451379 RepID=A0A0N5AF53_9BILA
MADGVERAVAMARRENRSSFLYKQLMTCAPVVSLDADERELISTAILLAKSLVTTTFFSSSTTANYSQRAAIMFKLLTALLLSLVICANAQQFNANQYPSPLSLEQYKQCNMKSPTNICDPDQVISQNDRYRLDNALKQIGYKSKAQGTNFCDTKGVQAVLAISKKGPVEAAKQLNNAWKLDEQCKKSVVFFLSADDHKLYYSGAENTGLSESEFRNIVAKEQSQLDSNNITGALSNIFKEVAVRTARGTSSSGGEGQSRADRIPDGAGVVKPSLLIAFATLLLAMMRF